MLVSSIDYNDYVGRIGIGRVDNGILKVGQTVAICNYHSDAKPVTTKVVSLYQFDGLGKVKVEEASPGDIVCFSAPPISPSAIPLRTP